jgi:hypothetical protein
MNSGKYAINPEDCLASQPEIRTDKKHAIHNSLFFRTDALVILTSAPCHFTMRCNYIALDGMHLKNAQGHTDLRG